MTEGDPLPEYCEPCHGFVEPRTRFELVRDWLAFELVLASPAAWTARGLGWRWLLWLLPYAGNHAYACTCPEKVLRP